MRSKLCLLGLFALLPACSLKLNDKVSKPQTSVSTGTGCLSQAGDVLDHFQKGTLELEEHEKFYRCVNGALTQFTENVDGRNKEYFMPGELATFLTKYFLNGKVVQEGLVSESMALKAAIVGGSSEKLTREDLRHIIRIFNSLEKYTGLLRPLMPLRASSFVERGYTVEQFGLAMKTFISASAEFGASLQEQQGSYQFERFEGLVKELRTFLYDGNVPEGHWTDVAVRIARAMPPAKAIFISPPRDEITQADWPRIFRLAPRYYAFVLRVQFYMNSPFSALYGGGLQTIEQIFNDFVGTFEFVLDQHRNQVISSEEIDDLVLTFYNQKMLDCRPETARQFIKAMFGHLLGDAGNTNSDRSKDKFEINRESLSHVKRAARFLLEGLHASETLYRTKHGDKFLSGSMTRDEIAQVPATVLLDSTTLKSDLSLEAVEAVKRTAFDIRTVFTYGNWGVQIPKVGDIADYSYMHMIKMLALRSVNRLVIEAYGDPRQSKLSEAQLDAFLNDIFPAMIELRLTSPSLKASISKRLFEASLFLYSSDGDRGLTMNEALELEALIMSTLETAPRMHAFMATQCSETRKSDDGDTLIPAACYRQQFARDAKVTWGYLPGLAEYFDSLKSEQQLALFDKMNHFLRKDTQAGDFSLSDSQAFVLLPYYVELLFSRFDANKDGKLDNKEAEAAYLVFRPFIAEKAAEKGYNSPKDHQAIFNFLLAHRELPTEAQISYAIRRYLLGPEKFAVDRGQVIEIFDRLMAM